MTIGDSLDLAIERFHAAMGKLRSAFNDGREPSLRKTEDVKLLLKEFEEAEKNYKTELKKFWP